ncbi:queuosine precursor transporter [Patescibacteria group bacterium]|nr:queuosine precursor transporter [Patescibacteria group bacterium]MBU1890051.1 queuosine precursor transporter [Patescibacteria group bacterium]
MLFDRKNLPSRRDLLVVGFVTTYVMANIISVKFVKLFWLNLPAGTFLFPLTFLFTDAFSELYGRKEAQRLVWLGFYANLLVILIIKLSIWLTPANFWEHSEAYNLIINSAPKIIVASLVAYIISQSHDVWAFHFWRRITKGRWLWLRNNASTIISQLIDTVVLIGILYFFGIVPAAAAFSIISSQYLVKIVFALIDTPLCYILVWRRKNK